MKSNTKSRRPTSLRPVVAAAFRASWDARVLGFDAPASGVDAVLYSTAGVSFDPPGKAIRVFMGGVSQRSMRGGVSEDASARVVVYSSGEDRGGSGAGVSGSGGITVHHKKGGDWTVSEILRHLCKHHGVRRVGFGGDAGMFRELAGAGLLDEVSIKWEPCVIGGNANRVAAPVTGLEPEFLPRGMALTLVSLKRSRGQCLIRYRVQYPRMDV